VSSKAIFATAPLGLSPASIRRTLNELTMMGLLLQPHTSAGRVPTDHAFRVFVNALRASSSRMDDGTREALSSAFRDLHPSQTASWRETVRILSDLSTQTALAITPAVSDSILRQMKFIPLDARQILAVVVTREGIVHNSYLRCEEALSGEDLERIHNYLSEMIVGRTLNEVRALLEREMEDARRCRDELRERASWLGSLALEASGAKTSELLVEGRDRLLAQPELEGRLQEVMSRLEQRGRILDLLDKAAAADEGPLVIIGREGGEAFDGFAMITAPFGKDGSRGRIGIVGSMRMNYPAMIPLVELSAKLLDRALADDGD
jgi:heat-inducible transcriptional repressor